MHDVAEHWLRLHRVAYAVAVKRFGLSASDAEDIAQEVVVRALQHAQAVNVSWAFQGAVFLCIDRARAMQRRHLGERLEGGALPNRDIADVECKEAIEHLPALCRDVLMKRFWEGFTWQEIDEERGSGRGCSQYQAKRCLSLLAKRWVKAESRPRSK